MDDIELDDIRVVSVTGKAYRDKPRSREEEKCWNPSLRTKILLIFGVLGLIFVIAAVVLVTQMTASLENLDKEALNRSVFRYVMFFNDDMARLQPYTRHAAWQKEAADAADELRRQAADVARTGRPFRPPCMGPPAPSPGPAVNQFIQRFLRTTIVYHENGTTEHVYRCDSLINWWGIIDPVNLTWLWSEYHPGLNGEYCSLSPFTGCPQPYFPDSYFQHVLKNGDPIKGWFSIFSPVNVPDPVSVSVEAIMVPDESGAVKDTTIHGYLVAAKTIERHMSTFASNVPGCISVISQNRDEEEFDEEDLESWKRAEPGYIDGNKYFSGKPYFSKRKRDYLNQCKVRFCPPIPLFEETEELITAHFTLCGVDPKVRRENNTCIRYRMDRPMERVEEGQQPVILLSVLIVGLILILFVVFIVFLDLAVLRRVVNLSNAIRKQTVEQHEAFMGLDKGSGRKMKDFDDEARAGGDEIKSLKLAVEQNTYRLRKRLEAVNDVAKFERQKILRHKHAMQLLSLWCDRYEFFPGLRPNAVLLRYEPTRSLDDLLSNPLAVEYLKSHCDADCTLEHMFFLFDVSWLSELEVLEDEEQDPGKRKQIHRVAVDTAATIIERYIAADAPQQINISASAFQVLREKGSSYERDMFKEAVSEVKLMLDTDILPRFRRTTAYTAMSENLYVDSYAYAGDNELSSESVSTTGSVLSDEVEAGASHMVAFNFRNLYATFDNDTDVASTCTNEMSIIEDPLPASITLGSGKAGTVSSTKDSSNRIESTSSGTDDTGTTVTTGTTGTTITESREKLAEKKEEKKKESEGSDDSSDSSSRSMSNDSSSSDSSK